MPSIFVQLLSGEILTYRSSLIHTICVLRDYVARDLNRDPEELTFTSITGVPLQDSHMVIREVDELYHVVVSPFFYKLRYEDKTFSLYRVNRDAEELIVSYTETEESFYTGETAFYWVAQIACRYGRVPTRTIPLEYDFSEDVYQIMSRDLADAGEIVPEDRGDLVKDFCKELLNLQVN